MMHCFSTRERVWSICFMLLLSVTIPTTSQQSFPLPMTIPWSDSIKSNEYLCTSVPVPHNATYIVRYEPMMNTSVVHHMLLYGCIGPYSSDNIWDCKGMGQLCNESGSPHILFGWGRNASGIQLPQGVGFRVRGSSEIDWLVLQLHYGDLPDNRHQYAGSINGLTIRLTSRPKQSLAGVFLLAAYAFKSIPPTTNVVNFDLACKYNDKDIVHGNPIIPFAYRVHAHSLGVRITGYVVKNDGSDWVELGSRSPQDPQAFYPVTSNVTVNPGDYLAARCIYSSVGISSVTHIGVDTSDEMCNFYIMYSTENNPSAHSFGACADPAPPDLEFPEQDDYQCPDVVPPIAWQRKEDTLFVDQQWILNNVVGSEALSLLGVALGQVTAVQARAGHVYVLHRGIVQWDRQSFNQSDYYMHIAAGPIKQSTVLELNSTGHLISQWGENMFYMPHGLTIDSQGNYWITDVAMHQVFKFTPQRNKALELGVAFSPGNDHSHFCKPASVAVDTVTGVVFVADGYCNSRIMLFSPTGEFLMEQSEAPSNLGMNVVHKLVIVEKLDQLLVADRENGRVLAYRLHNMELLWSMKLPDLGGTVYSIDVNSSGVLKMFAVAKTAGIGVTVDQSGTILDKWSPSQHVKFLNPHDVAMDTDGSAVYVTEIGPNRIWRFIRRGTNENNITKSSSTAPPTSNNRYLSTPLVSSSSSVYVTTSSSIYVTISSTSKYQYFSTSIVNSVTTTPVLRSSSAKLPATLYNKQTTPTKQVPSSSYTKEGSSSSYAKQASSSSSKQVSSSSSKQVPSSSYTKEGSSSSYAKQASSSSSKQVPSSSYTKEGSSSYAKQAPSTDSQSHFTITSTTASTQLHTNIQTSSVSVVSSSVTSLSFTAVNNGASNVSSGTSTDRSSALQVVALVLSGLVILVALVMVVLTIRYCNYGNNLHPQNLRKKLFPMNGHHGFTQLRTFDPDVSDDELTVFTKF